MNYLIYFSILLPVLIALLIYFFLEGSVQRWPFNLLLRAFIWGLLSIIPVIIVQLVADMFGLDHLTNLRRVIFYALAVMAFFSELSKFFFLKFFYFPRKDFKTPIDGIIFSVIIAMGFATMNNILTFINIPNLSVNAINAWTAGPANIIFGILLGFFVGLGKMRNMRFIDTMTGLAGAVFFHALYDFCLLTKDYKLLIAFFIGAIIVVVSLWFVSLKYTGDMLREEKK